MYILTLDEAVRAETRLVGGKAKALASLFAAGEKVPRSLCITTEAYETFLEQCNIREKIALELHRKDFAQMRWEEIWDSALRIRKLFVNATWPDDLSGSIGDEIVEFFADSPLAVRSSSPEEDSAKASFAGLHDSFIQITGKENILEHIKKVWASLWSDASLLYRQEIGLDPKSSAIAVLVQEVIDSDVSGVMFSRSPEDNELTVIEAVYGLNQGLVDGTIEPDRWHVRINDRTIASHNGVEREHRIVPGSRGTDSEELSSDLKAKAPLTKHQVVYLAEKAFQLEKHFGLPQDVEWTYADTILYILQSRPITTLKGSNDNENDKRPWYLSLHRSLDNLQDLHGRIVGEILPAMDAEARELAAQNIASFNDTQLADEIRQRIASHAKWVDVYWADFIPFAHGMRLFGEFYNDRMKPDDPYAFVSLLRTGAVASLKRNHILNTMGDIARSNPDVRRLLKENRPQEIEDPQFREAFQELQSNFGELHLSLGNNQHMSMGEDLTSSLILKFAEADRRTDNGNFAANRQELEQQFFAAFTDPREKEMAHALLELGRASYTLRDDDNLYLGRIEQQMNRALDEARSRLQKRHPEIPSDLDNESIVACLEDPDLVPTAKTARSNVSEPGVQPAKETKRARQLLGQPAGPGIARGKARVVNQTADLHFFEENEILVCDSIDPNMTFIVPLAAGIVERRGGMLIHGAIIAREYGIACVTGIPDATNLITTGDTVTVDGYLGIVTISHAKDPLF